MMPTAHHNPSQKLKGMLPNVFAGLVSWMMTLIASISYATLIFSGALSGHLTLGICSTLVSAAVVGFIVAWRSAAPFIIAGPDANISALLAVMAASVGVGLGRGAAPAVLGATLWVVMALSTLSTGVFLYLVGKFHFGHWIRFIPYPVVGGFLAGTGWLLIRGSFVVMADVPLTLENLPVLVRYENVVHWLPGAVFALVLFFALRRYTHFLVMPSLFIAAILLAHACIRLAGLPVAEAAAGKWLLEPLPGNPLLDAWRTISFREIDWPAVANEVGILLVLMIVSAIVILLNAASVEIQTKSDLDLDNQLRSTGLANVLASAAGGLVGCITLSRTLLNWKAGADGRLSGMLAAVLSAGILFLGMSHLDCFPTPVLGAMLLYLGLNLMAEWVVDGWSRFSRFDYFLVLTILVVVATQGFLQGVGIGLVGACILFAFNYSRIRIIKHELTGVYCRSNVERSYRKQQILSEKGEQIYILRLQGYIFFGTAYPLLFHIRRRIQSQNPSPVRFVLLDFTHVNGLDSSSVLTFNKIRQICEANGVRLIFVHLTARIESLLEESGCIGPSATARLSPVAEESCMLFIDLDHAVEWCEEEILKAEGVKHTRQAHALQALYSELFPEGDSFDRLHRYLERVEAHSGRILFRQGTPSDALYFVESGRVTVWLELQEGKRTRLRTMGGGAVVGEMGFYLGTPRSGTIETEKPSVLHRLSAEAFQRMEKDDAQLASAFHQFMVRLLANRLVYTNKQIADLQE